MPPYKIVAGVRTDYEALLRNFQQTKSVRFEEFSKIWRQMGMSNIYCGHENEKELMAFTDECLLLALSFCLPPHSFQWRTGGMYLVYGMYLKQPNAVKAKIRVTLEQWREIVSFIEEVKEQSHHDIHFVFLKLLQNHAFHFVSSPREMAPFYRDLGEGTASCYFLETSALKELLDDGYCDQMEAIHQRYVAIKSQVLAKNLCVNSIDEDFFSSFVSKIEEFERKRLTLVDGYDNEQDASDNQRNHESCDDSEKVEEDIGARRGMLKKLVMGQRGSTSRSRRHRAVEIASASTTSTSPKKKKQKTSATKGLAKKPGSSSEAPSSPNSNQSANECRMSMPTFTGEDQGKCRASNTTNNSQQSIQKAKIPKL